MANNWAIALGAVGLAVRDCDFTAAGKEGAVCAAWHYGNDVGRIAFVIVHRSSRTPFCP